MSEVSRLNVIERWECPNGCGAEPMRAAAPEGVERWRCYPCGVEAVWVEYVPRDQLAGAVDLIREAAEIAGRPTTVDEDMYGRVVVIGSKLRTALSRLGGQ